MLTTGCTGAWNYGILLPLTVSFRNISLYHYFNQSNHVFQNSFIVYYPQFHIPETCTHLG